MLFRGGDRIDRYELLAQLGEGGQGTVWKGRDMLPPHEERALKLVSLKGVSGTAVERTRREAHLLAELRHPALVRCHGLFESYEHGVIGLVLDFADGANLREYLNDPRFDRWHRQAVLRQVAEALAYLHGRGLLHRDVKLENVVVAHDFWRDPTAPGAVRLVDFGISAAVGNPGGLTDVGHFIGTLPYMAPEMIDPSRWPAPSAAPAVDVFAFGVLGGMLLRGGHPTGLAAGATGSEYARGYEAIEQGRGAWLGTGAVDIWDDVLRRCVEPSATTRLPDAAAILQALDASPDRRGAQATADYRPPAPTGEQAIPRSVQPAAAALPATAPRAPPLAVASPGPARTSEPVIHRQLPAAAPVTRGRSAVPLFLGAVLLVGLLLGGGSLVAGLRMFSNDDSGGSPPPSRGMVPCPADTNRNPCQTQYSEVPGSLADPIVERDYYLRLSWISMKGGSKAPETLCFRRDGEPEQCATTPASEATKCGRGHRITVSPADLMAGRIAFRTFDSGGVETATGRFKPYTTPPLNRMLCVGAKLDIGHLVSSTAGPAPMINAVFFYLDPK